MLMKAIKAGVAYFAMVFAAGFVLGSIRVTLITPMIGATAAVLLEMPVMLAISWVACRWCLRRFEVRGIRPVASMAAVAFVLLAVTELGMAALLFGRTLAEQVAAFGTLAGAIGLAGQGAFVLLPLLQDRLHRGLTRRISLDQ